MALKISYPEPGDNVPQWATEDTQLQIKAILEKQSRPSGSGNKADKEKEEQTKKGTKALKGLSEGFDELTGLVGTTAGVLTSTKGEFKDLIPIVDNFGNLVKKASSALLKAVPIFGDALAAGGELFVEFTKDAFSFLATTTDNVAEAFRGAASRGAFFENSLAKLIDAANGAIITLEELDGILALNQTAIATFGDASTGAKQVLNALARVQTDFGDDLGRLGLTISEVNESASGFFDLLATTGQASLLRAGQEGELAAQTNRYIKDLTILASITGQERKEVEAEFRRQVQRGNVQAQLALMQQKGIEGGMQDFGNLSVVLNEFNPILADAFASIATLGVATAEQEAVLSQLGNARQLIDEFGASFRAGTLTDAEAKAQTEAIFREISNGVRDPNFLKTAALGTGPVTGLPATLAEVAATALPLAQSLDDVDVNLGNLATQIDTQTKTQDQGINKLLEAQRALAQVPIEIQKALLGEKGGVPVINTALESVADNVKAFSDVLVKITRSGGGMDALESIFFGEGSGGGQTPNLPGTDVFDTFDIFSKAVNQAMINAGYSQSQAKPVRDDLFALKGNLTSLDEAGLKQAMNAIIDAHNLEKISDGKIKKYQRGTQGVENFGNGTLAMLHGKEAVIPAPNGEIPVDLGNAMAPILEEIQRITNEATRVKQAVDTPGVNSVQSNMVAKLDEMIAVLKSIADGTAQGNNIFGKEIRRLGSQMSADLFR